MEKMKALTSKGVRRFEHHFDWHIKYNVAIGLSDACILCNTRTEARHQFPVWSSHNIVTTKQFSPIKTNWIVSKINLSRDIYKKIFTRFHRSLFTFTPHSRINDNKFRNVCLWFLNAHLLLWLPIEFELVKILTAAALWRCTSQPKIIVSKWNVKTIMEVFNKHYLKNHQVKVPIYYW